jgi:hypothetical protein
MANPERPFEIADYAIIFDAACGVLGGLGPEDDLNDLDDPNRDEVNAFVDAVKTLREKGYSILDIGEMVEHAGNEYRRMKIESELGAEVL